MDQRNAGQSRGLIEMDHGWDTYTRDQLAIMDQLGFDKFHTLGACIGGTYCLNIARLAPERVCSFVLQNPIGMHPDHPEYFHGTVDKWAIELMAERDDIDSVTIEFFKQNMSFIFVIAIPSFLN